MDESNNTIFTHAKMEYTAQLVDILTPQLFDGMKSIYDESKVVYKTDRSKSILIIFRLFLGQKLCTPIHCFDRNFKNLTKKLKINFFAQTSFKGVSG